MELTLEMLKIHEEILAFSYWENFKFEKDMAQALGGQHPRVQKIMKDLNEIREEWHEVQQKIKEHEEVK